MLGVRAIERAAGAAHHFDGACFLGDGFHQPVDVAKARRAQRHTVFEIEERARARAAGQHGRADGCQMFDAAALLDADARDLIEKFARLSGLGEIDDGFADFGDVAGVGGACLAIARGGHHHLLHHGDDRLGGARTCQRHQCRTGQCCIPEKSTQLSSTHVRPRSPFFGACLWSGGAFAGQHDE